jgi:hypothetical protein
MKAEENAGLLHAQTVQTKSRDGYNLGYSSPKNEQPISSDRPLSSFESMVRRGGLEPPRDCSR